MKSLFIYAYPDIISIVDNLEEKTMNVKKIVLFTIILMITISSLSIVSAGLFGDDTQEVTVGGVNFILDNSIKITGQQDDFINFAVKTGTTGFLSTIENDEDSNSYIQNDTEFGYTVFEVGSIGDIKEYGFIDEGIDKGYFIIFEKDDKNFVYCINTELNANDNEVKEIAELMTKFTKDNKDLKPI